MRITSARYNTSGGLDIAYLDFNYTTKAFERTSFVGCKQAPLDEQAKAFDALKPILLDICELPKDWSDDIDVNGFSIHWQKNEHFKVSIQSIRHLRMGGPLVLNSPQRNVTAEDEGAANILTDAQMLLVEAAMEAAKDYLCGKRSAEPESETEVIHRTAYAKGRKAYEDGNMLFNNPYDEEKDGKDAFDSWIQGFTDAEQNKGSAVDESEESEVAE